MTIWQHKRAMGRQPVIFKINKLKHCRLIAYYAGQRTFIKMTIHIRIFIYWPYVDNRKKIIILVTPIHMHPVHNQLQKPTVYDKIFHYFYSHCFFYCFEHQRKKKKRKKNSNRFELMIIIIYWIVRELFVIRKTKTKITRAQFEEIRLKFKWK